MSQENVELVRRANDAYNRRDLDGMLEIWAPDAVLDWSRSRRLDAGVHRGHLEIRAFAEEFLATWDEVRIEIVDDPVEVEDGLLSRRTSPTCEDETASKFRLEARG
jgi:ketosteroid isomerase-like protein